MAALTHVTRAHDRTWLPVFVIVGAGIVAAMQVGKAAIAAPILRDSLGIDLTSIGWLMAIFAILGMVGGIPVGAFITAFGDRRILLLGLLTIAIAAALGAMTASFQLLLATRVLEGLGFILVTIAGPALITRVSGAGQRDIAFGLWSCFMPAGIALAMVAGPLFSTWQALWWASAILAAAAFLSAVVFLPRSIPGSRLSWSGIYKDTAAILRAGAPVILALAFALYSLQFFALFSFLPVLLTERMGISLQTAGLLSAVATGVNIIGNLAAGFLIARGARRWMLVAAASMVMGLSSIGIFLPLLPEVAVFALCMLFSAAGGLIPATLLATAPLLSPQARLTPFAVGLCMQGSNFGQVVGPVAVGSVIQTFGWSSVAAIVVIAAAAGIVMALSLRCAVNE